MIVYDLECYPNIFTATFKHIISGEYRVYEISTRRNDVVSLMNLLLQIKQFKTVMIGYNNVSYDYVLLHFLMENYGNERMFTDRKLDRYAHNIRGWEVVLPQLDLFKIHHFDNMTKATSLKALEFAMRSENVQDLPFPPAVAVPQWGFDLLLDYNKHDVDETHKFFNETEEEIRFRDSMTERLGVDCTNFNDVKIGKTIFVQELEKAKPGCCYDSNKKVRQTKRGVMVLKDLVFPWVHFEMDCFNEVLAFFNSKTITETKGVFKGLSAKLQDGFSFDFGLGGIHGSIKKTFVNSDENYIIVDWDVVSFYPSLAIVNRLFPEHLGVQYCDTNLSIFEDRKNYPKKTHKIINTALKLAVNGAYGATNDQYSPLYDPEVTMTTTINGQLLLCMLAEQLLKIPNLSMVQANTDGITVKCPRAYEQNMIEIVSLWERFTKLEMERQDYTKMYLRDVNNYLAVKPCGEVKRKGAYAYGDDLGWEKNHSSQIVAKAAEAKIVHDKCIITSIVSHTDINDFMILGKVPKTSRLMWGEDEIQRISRYLVTRSGKPLTKIMPPLKGKIDPRKFAINKGWLTTPCNDLRSGIPNDIDYRFYIEESKKLVFHN